VWLVSPIGGATGGSGNLSTSLSNVVRQAAHPKFVWVFNANCDGTIIYNDPVYYARRLISIVYKRMDILQVVSTQQPGILGASKCAEQLNGAMSTHIRK
jgi:hypothetical protein